MSAFLCYVILFFEVKKLCCVKRLFTYISRRDNIAYKHEMVATPHKGGKVHSYDLEFKVNAIRYAEMHGKFNADRKRVRDWRAKNE